MQEIRDGCLRARQKRLIDCCFFSLILRHPRPTRAHYMTTALSNALSRSKECATIVVQISTKTNADLRPNEQSCVCQLRRPVPNCHLSDGACALVRAHQHSNSATPDRHIIRAVTHWINQSHRGWQRLISGWRTYFCCRKLPMAVAGCTKVARDLIVVRKVHSFLPLRVRSALCTAACLWKT